MRRALAVNLVLAVSLVSHGAVAARRAAPNSSAVGAADEPEPKSPDDAWPVVLGCTDDPQLDPEADVDFEQAWPRMRQCGEAAREIVSLGNDDDRERLWSVFDELPEASPWRGDVIDAFLDWHLHNSLARLAGEPVAARTPPPVSDAELPEFLQAAPRDLQDAWRLYDVLGRAYAKMRDQHGSNEAITFQSNQPVFQRAIADFLRGRTSVAQTVRDVSRFEWGGWCGTGSGMLYAPQSKTLLIAFLQLGQYEQALAASAGLETWSFGNEQAVVRWDRRLLAAAGIDWEPVYIGGVVAGEAALAETLASHGSEGGARQLLSAALALDEAVANRREGAPDYGDQLLWPLAALVESSGSCPGEATLNSREVQRAADAPPVGGDVQEGVLELLAEKVGPGAALPEADAASHLLLQRCRPESRAAFRAMLRSPYGQLRQRGAIGLRGLGETVAEPFPARPVAFRLIVNGKPAAQRKVEWTLLKGEGGRESSTADTDRDGILRLERDPFMDPRNRITSVLLTAPNLTSATDAWFAVSLDRPADLDAGTTASIRTGSLTVLIPESLAGSAGRRPLTLQLVAETVRYGPVSRPLPISRELSIVSPRITFPHLQRGRYQAWLHGPGGLHMSPEAEVGERPATVAISERSVEEDAESFSRP
jgi:hypothetical protein